MGRDRGIGQGWGNRISWLQRRIAQCEMMKDRHGVGGRSAKEGLRWMKKEGTEKDCDKQREGEGEGETGKGQCSRMKAAGGAAV